MQTAKHPPHGAAPALRPHEPSPAKPPTLVAPCTIPGPDRGAHAITMENMGKAILSCSGRGVKVYLEAKVVGYPFRPATTIRAEVHQKNVLENPVLNADWHA